jgi:hypothetical protein
MNSVPGVMELLSDKISRSLLLNSSPSSKILAARSLADLNLLDLWLLSLEAGATPSVRSRGGYNYSTERYKQNFLWAN